MSRYKVKQRRKKGPAVRLDFSCRHDDELDLLLEKNVPLFACCAEKMYDEVWPRWRMYGIVQVSLRTLHADEMSEINAEFRSGYMSGAQGPEHMGCPSGEGAAE